MSSNAALAFSQPYGNSLVAPGQAPVRHLGKVLTETDIVREFARSRILGPQALQIARHMVAESARTGVPGWLILAQAEFETSYGNVVNCTVQLQRQIRAKGRVVRVGSAHNLFNITEPNLRTGEYLEIANGIKYRAYQSFEEGITDFCNLMLRVYRDLSCQAFLNRYFPVGTRRGENTTSRQNEYFTTLHRAALRLGQFQLTRATVVLPSR